MVREIPSMLPLYTAHLPWVFGLSEEAIFHIIERYMERTRDLKWVLFNSFQHLEAPIIDSLIDNGALVCSIGP